MSIVEQEYRERHAQESWSNAVLLAFVVGIAVGWTIAR